MIDKRNEKEKYYEEHWNFELLRTVLEYRFQTLFKSYPRLPKIAVAVPASTGIRLSLPDSNSYLRLGVQCSS